jgi:high-affinity nickel permease
MIEFISPVKKETKIGTVIGHIISGLLLAFIGIATLIVMIVIGRFLFIAFMWAITFRIGG